MVHDDFGKVIIVEGTTDKRKIEKIITERVEIICTYGTFSIERFDELLEEYDLDNQDVYILVDEDKAGIKLRKKLGHELPNARHLYVSEEYGEVASTPEEILAQILVGNHIRIDPFYLLN